MKKYKITQLATAMTLSLSLGLVACGAGSGGSASSSQPRVLDGTQTQLGRVVLDLGSQLATVDSSGPLKPGAFVTCLEPTVNEVLDGPDALLTQLLQTVNAGASGGLNAGASAINPLALKDGVFELANGLQSLTTNLPQALLALAGQGQCTTSGSPGGSNPLSFVITLASQPNTPLQPLIDALIVAGVPADGGGLGPTGTSLDVLLGPLSQLAGRGGAPADLAELSGVIDDLGLAVETLSVALTNQLSSQAQGAAVPVVTLLSSTLEDISMTLVRLDSAGTTNQQLLGTLSTLLNTLNTTVASIPGSNGLVAPLQNGITQLRGTLTAVSQPLSQLLGTLATSGSALQGGQLQTLTSLIGSLLGPLATSAGGMTGSNGTGSTGMIGSIPVIGPIFGSFLGS